MPHFMFYVKPEHEVPGCVSRVCIQIPWLKPVQMADQNGNPVVVAPQQAAWNFITAQQLPWPQGVNVELNVINGQSTCRAPLIYCIQDTKPVIDPAQVNAPYSTPLGSSRVLTMPPMAAPKGSQAQYHGQYEVVDNSGVVNNDDPLMGAVDGFGGTFSDLDSTGREAIREMAIPPSEMRPR